jgi:lipoprotein-releasing system permease protein
VRMPEYIVQGKFDVQGTNAVIGTDLAKDLGVRIGDKIRLLVAAGPEQVRSDILTVAGLFDIGNREVNRRWVFTTLRVSQALLDIPGGVSNVDMVVTDVFGADKVADTLRAQLPLTVESWMQTNAQILVALRNQSLTNGIIRGFVVVIVALGIASVLVVSVVQKQKEIGILRAMGASARRIMAVFLIQGALVGFVGSLSGALLAAGLLKLFSRIFRSVDGGQLFGGDLPIDMIFTASAVAIVVGLLSALIPSRRAAQMDPVQAIRS